MIISFRINADSEAVLTEAAKRALREAPAAMALDWLLDMQAEVVALYSEIHADTYGRSYGSKQ